MDYDDCSLLFCVATEVSGTEIGRVSFSVVECYKVHILKYSILVFYLSILMLCYFILLPYYILEAINVLFTPLLHLTIKILITLQIQMIS